MKTKVSLVLKSLLIVIISIALVIALCVGGFFLFYKPTITFDAKNLTGAVTSGASGYLYGIAEDGVPSYEMVESLDISSISTKTQGGLQHPISEVGDIATEVIAGGACDYIVVYLQDMYDTWYYDHENITEMKKQGTYDWKSYIENTFFPMVQQTVNDIKASDYSNKIVYCLYNECDNAIWFGPWIKDSNNETGGYSDFNDEGKQNFYDAWKLTYDFVKSLDADALIGGPGNYEYNSEKMEGFLSFTSENNCNPDILIYHELNDRSIYDFGVNVAELRRIEEKYGLSTDTPIIVTEYGRMWDNGNPNTMLKYITQIEYSKVYANQAYWLLADNLCNTAADYNTPNSAWWVYRWYADMSGQTMNAKISDIIHSDFEKAYKEKREFRYQRFMGLGTITDDKDKIEILVSGADYNGNIKIKNLKNTALSGKTVNVTVSAVTYQGLSGKVYEPELVKSYNTLCNDSLKVKLNGMNENTAYRIEIREASESDYDDFENDNLYERYEFESGTLLGDAYTYDSAYATTGELNGMVGGMEKEGDGIEIIINVPHDDDYELMFIYGNSNDGEYGENGRQNPEDRTFSDVNFSIDNEVAVLSLSNTVRSEITNSYTMNYQLSKGKHTIRVTHNKGTIVLDSLLIRRSELSPQLYVLKDDGRQTPSFLVISYADGYYDIATRPNTQISVDGATAKTDDVGNAVIYLRRGLNYIDVLSDDEVNLTAVASEKAGNIITLAANDAALSDGAECKTNDTVNVSYIDEISSQGGSASYVINVSESGTYKMTILYANNDEQGVHDYNVDLVERFITISVNGSNQKELYCRNTYSWDTFETVTVNLELEQGENYITLFNDGFNQFDGRETFAPHISQITINDTQAK